MHAVKGIPCWLWMEQSFFLACPGNRIVVNPSKQLQHLKDAECIDGV